MGSHPEAARPRTHGLTELDCEKFIVLGTDRSGLPQAKRLLESCCCRAAQKGQIQGGVTQSVSDGYPRGARRTQPYGKRRTRLSSRMGTRRAWYPSAGWVTVDWPFQQPANPPAADGAPATSDSRQERPLPSASWRHVRSITWATCGRRRRSTGLRNDRIIFVPAARPPHKRSGRCLRAAPLRDGVAGNGLHFLLHRLPIELQR